MTAKQLQVQYLTRFDFAEYFLETRERELSVVGVRQGTHSAKRHFTWLPHLANLPGNV